MAIIKWDKKYTETLAETLKRFRLENPEYENEKITYAGRLDPMAEGLVILLTGIDVYKKDNFLGMGKIYEIDFMFGPETDTYDILGLCTNNSTSFVNIDIESLESKLNKHIGKFQQKYPPFSSKPVSGKPLFFWARENRLNEIEIPEKEIEIYSISHYRNIEIPIVKLKNSMIKNIQNVIGDFRQSDIIEKWLDYFNKNRHLSHIKIHTITVHSSSGSYMRTLINEIAKSLGTTACTIKINRKQIGDYML